MQKFILEIATFSIEGALSAATAGADRIELCENPADGGTTPSFGSLKLARKKIQLPVFPIIRPRAGDFLYSDDEFEAMQHDLLLCKNLGFDGVVLGILQSNGMIDKKRAGRLVAMAYPMDVTFHRAFDRCKEPGKALEDVIETGCSRILTSGQYPKATEGMALIKRLVKQANDRIVIMPGSGVNSTNLKHLVDETGARDFHASARIAFPSQMNFEVESMAEKNQFMGVDPAEVNKMKMILNDLSS